MPPVIIGSEPKTHQQLLEEQRQFQLDLHRDAQAAENRRNVKLMAAKLRTKGYPTEECIALAIEIADKVDLALDERIEAAKKEAQSNG